MTRTTVRRSASAAIAALLLAVGATVSMAPAHAEQDKNQVFIEFLDKKGVPYKSRTEAVRMAKAFCVDVTRQGSPMWKAGYDLAFKGGWTETEAMAFLEGAVPTYCPQLWQ